MRLSYLLPFFVFPLGLIAAEPLPIDSLWKSETFRKSITASYGIDSRIEPRITEDEAFYLDESAAAMAADDRETAIKVLAESSILERSAAMLFTLAGRQFEEGITDESLKNFEAAIALFPNFRDAHRNYAVALIQTGKFDVAKPHLIRALELGAQDGTTAGLLGYCHAREDHHRAALDAFRLAMLTQPSERQWIIGEAQALQALGQTRDAANLYQSLIDAEPTESNLWLTQADTWIALDTPLKAIANLELVHRSGTLTSSATISLGHLYLQSDLPDLACDRYRAALIAAEPAQLDDAIDALEMLVNSAEWARAGEIAALIESSEPYRPLLNSETPDKDLLSRLTRARALVELETGDAAAGAKLVEAWLGKDPLDGHSLLLLSRFREESGQREEAEMLLEQAEGLSDVSSAAHLRHGRLLVSEREYAKALEHLEKSYELEPHDSLAEYLEAVRELAPDSRDSN
jgi:tetratricopeptide (TPR) repeat protein